MSVLKVNQIQTANGVIMANLNSSGANIGFQLASTLAPAFSASPTTQQTGVANSTETKVVLGTKEFDTAGCFNNTGSTVTLNGISVPSYSFAPNVAGYYFFTGTIWTVLSGAINKGWTAVWKNGTAYVEGSYSYGPSNVNETGSTTSVIVYMNGTSDYVSLYTYAETSGASYALSTSTGPRRVRFNGCLIRSA